jgi:3-hydroxybutyryl-CoA dehydrogenase
MDKSGKKLIGVIGAGTMGNGIAQIAASYGHPVLLFDSRKEALENALKERKNAFARLIEKGKITDQDSQEITGRINNPGSMKDLEKCDLIIEAIVENAEIKQRLFKDLEEIVSEDCILASNTSSISITSIASLSKNPERILGLHFFNPAPVMPLVEIIPGLATSKKITVTARKIVDSWGKVTVIAKDTPGFIVNRVARPFYGEALRIYEEQWRGLPSGEKGMATIDWAMKEIGGFKMGPFELMDLIGNDVNYMVTETVWKQFFFDPRYKPSLTQKRLFESGRFGKKTGQGYYSYEEGSKLPEPEKNTELGVQIFSRIFSMLVNEAADALYYNVATRDDIDLAMTKGVNYPKGLLLWCDEAGPEKILSVLNALHKVYAEERYRPSVLLQHMATEKTKFYN